MGIWGILPRIHRGKWGREGQLSIVSILAGSGIGVGLVIILALLLRHHANHYANRYLAASLACSVCYLGWIIALHSGAVDKFPGLALLATPFLLSSPLLYGYARAMTAPDYRPGRRELIHLWPLLLVPLLLLPGGGTTDAASLAEARGGWPPNQTALMGIFFYGVTVLYLGLSLALVNRHGRQLVDEFSYQEKVSLNWLRLLVGVYLLLALTGLLLALLRLLPGVELWPRSIYSTGMNIALCYLIGFFAIAQPEIFARRPARAEGGTPLYETSALTAEDAATHWAGLRDYMASRKPFLDNELRIAELAGQVDIPARHLSQTINQHAGMNFFEFVNRYRVEEAKALLGKPGATVTEVAEASGFNSQSAFYRQFKQATGLTPKQFQRQVGPPRAGRSGPGS